VVARYVGRAGAGFICTSAKGEELYRDKLIPSVDEGLEKAGGGQDEIDRMIEIKLSCDPDPDMALDNARSWAPLAWTAEQKHGLHDPTKMEAAGGALPIEQVASRWIVASRPEQAIERITTNVQARLQPPGLPRIRPRPAPLHHDLRRAAGPPTVARNDLASLWKSGARLH
jgi:alkanesulfonate monooxygenase SsuD/methylene tetrahydromethanopterin reductase-like flavin-dependent oxidoreductase (luciferase family)